ncbi:MAG: hypothetical protein ACE5GA_10305 [Candidatus Zixiibacteriota bacterium]
MALRDVGVLYYLNDHLGAARAAVDESGAPVDQRVCRNRKGFNLRG